MLKSGVSSGIAQALVAELVVGASQAAGRCDGAEVVGERAVEADIERALAGVERGAELGKGELRLARSGGAVDAQPKGLELEPACPVCESAGNPGDDLCGPAPSRR
jgi:hypothetical protein